MYTNWGHPTTITYLINKIWNKCTYKTNYESYKKSNCYLFHKKQSFTSTVHQACEINQFDVLTKNRSSGRHLCLLEDFGSARAFEFEVLGRKNQQIKHTSFSRNTISLESIKPISALVRLVQSAKALVHPGFLLSTILKSGEDPGDEAGNRFHEST